ncbi:MAG TPA: molybdenum cofactor guanylyltransferase [Bryobacteraceae bacterium]|nr:molybdenum cofactor guanylyltransferase [Bryobacteraceae bacterium]
MAGFVLAGGASRRMGRDKAFLPMDGATLIETVAARVRGAAGSATIIGPMEKYSDLGFPVLPDAVENCGPLGGLYTALLNTRAEWNLIVACDMPEVTEEFLRILIDAAQASGADCLAPETSGRTDPLCAVYHARVLAAAESAINRKLLKMQDFVSTLQTSLWPVSDSRPLKNVNTPAEWSAR